MRGNRSVGDDATWPDGSIPARAGEPKRVQRKTGLSKVYPRACGGTGSLRHGLLPRPGLSPRVRGNLAATYRRSRTRWKRSIPARAGEPGGGSLYRRGSLDGLSPRVRGNRIEGVLGILTLRSIPARAGEPNCIRDFLSSVRVYPRACGGTYSPGYARTSLWGLSPRVRGNAIMMGLSPRVRGNPAQSQPFPPIQRSIPARAGEPMLSPVIGCTEHRIGVYPRACGGTRQIPRAIVTRGAGLSPRVRGNRRTGAGARKLAWIGSIPARAGEPRSVRRVVIIQPVYPRACGGTAAPAACSTLPIGLSPRVRGNQRSYHIEARRIRSIPARAGEPNQSGSGL